MNSQDFLKGADFTGINPVTGGDHNNLIELAVPLNDGSEEIGKGLVLVTTDTGLDIPNTPNPTLIPKWTRYPWYRRSIDGIGKPKHYLWDDNADNDLVFFKWVEVSVDLTDLQNQIDNALATASNAETVAGTVATNANNAIAIANTATNTANNAVTTANTALANSATADTDATNAVNTANNALTVANNKKTVNSALIAGTKYQEIRTNASADGVEWFNKKNNYAKIIQSLVKGNSAGLMVLNPYVRELNTVVHNPGNIVTLNVNHLVVNIPGTYRIKAWATWGIGVNAVTVANYGCQLFLLDASAGNVLIEGQSGVLGVNTASATVTGFAGPTLNLEGILTLALNDLLYLVTYRSSGNLIAGINANVHPSGAGNEVYACIELELIDS